VYAKTAESHFHLVMVCDASHLIEARNLFEQGCRKPKVWLDTINAHAVELESLKECFANYNAIT